MNKGIEILIKRMESNPDEFKRNGRWHIIINQINTDFLTQEDVETFKTAYAQVREQHFTESVIQTLFEVENEEEYPTERGTVSGTALYKGPAAAFLKHIKNAGLQGDSSED